MIYSYYLVMMMVIMMMIRNANNDANEIMKIPSVQINQDDLSHKSIGSNKRFFTKLAFHSD